MNDTTGPKGPIATILLLPHAEHRERLLAPGAPVYDKVLRVWGWAVPTPSGSPAPYGWIDNDADTLGLRRFPPDSDTCLVLARESAEVYEGIDRAGRVLWEQRIRAATLELEVRIVLGREPGLDVEIALERLRQIVAPLGTLVLLDADGKDVSDV